MHVPNSVSNGFNKLMVYGKHGYECSCVNVWTLAECFRDVDCVAFKEGNLVHKVVGSLPDVRSWILPVFLWFTNCDQTTTFSVNRTDTTWEAWVGLVWQNKYLCEFKGTFDCTYSGITIYSGIFQNSYSVLMSNKRFILFIYLFLFNFFIHFITWMQ